MDVTEKSLEDLYDLRSSKDFFDDANKHNWLRNRPESATGIRTGFLKKLHHGGIGHITIWNFTGDIRVKGYKGNNITISAYKKSPDRDSIWSKLNRSNWGGRGRVVSIRLGIPSAAEGFVKLDEILGNISPAVDLVLLE